MSRYLKRNLSRRQFIKYSSAGAVLQFLPSALTAAETPGERPNILWITCEDISPNLGCYGDRFAVTPNLDRFAREAVRYTNGFAAAPVCSPSRSCLITGVYATTLGTQSQRCMVELPDTIRCFSEYLRTAGYCCVNNGKQDYNFTAPPGSWDEDSSQAHWRKNRKPGQPFFQMSGYNWTHSSMMGRPPQQHAERIKDLQPSERHDPAGVPMMPYYVDSPTLREAMAQYYDNITLMDKWAGQLLGQLEEDGLAEDTIVFFFPDQGGGMPRSKGYLYEGGLKIPLLIRFPKKYQHLAPAAPGSVVDEFVALVDFAPTMLRLAGLDAPAYMQGRVFLGDRAAPAPDCVYAAMDRAHGWPEMSRCVRDKHYKYIRHYLPFRPYMPDGFYLPLMPHLREMVELTAQGKASAPVAHFATRSGKPAEELYDLQADPHEINNLAGSSEHQTILQKRRKQLDQWMDQTRDLGFMPEWERPIRKPGLTPYELGNAGEDIYPRKKIRETIKLSEKGADALPALIEKLADSDAAIRYWAVIGITILRDRGKLAAANLKKCLSDTSVDVQLASAEALCRLGLAEDVMRTLVPLFKHADPEVRIRALGIMEEFREDARRLIADDLRPLIDGPDKVAGWCARYILGEPLEWGW